MFVTPIYLLCTDSGITPYEGDSQDDILSKFVYLGDDRNIVGIFVAGTEVHARVKGIVTANNAAAAAASTKTE